VPPALYQQIAEDLVQQLRGGALPAGSRLPTEMELMRQYAASRNTIRSALQQLQSIGLISRQRSRGTVVAAPPPAGAFTQSLSTLDDLVSLARTAQRDIRHSKEMVMPLGIARELGCPPGSRWLHIAMTRREARAAAPLTWTDAYVDPHYTGLRRLADKHPDKLLCDLIEASYGRRIATVEQTVSACIVESGLAEALGVDAGSAALRIRRQYRDPSRALVLVTLSVLPATRYSLATTLVRRAAP
jgi:DNA-binding GntR family transcriptional regulator